MFSSTYLLVLPHYGIVHEYYREPVTERKLLITCKFKHSTCMEFCKFLVIRTIKIQARSIGVQLPRILATSTANVMRCL